MEIKELAKQLTDYRKKREMTRYRICKETGLHQETVIAIETGHTGYNIQALLSYVRAIGLELSIHEAD